MNNILKQINDVLLVIVVLLFGVFVLLGLWNHATTQDKIRQGGYCNKNYCVILIEHKDEK